MLAQDLPKRFTLPATFYNRPRKRDAEPPDPPNPLRGPDLGRRQLRHVRFQVPVEKIENIVAGGADAGGECGPCDWREGGEGGSQPPIAAIPAESRQIGELAFRHVPFRNVWIQPVQIEEDQLLDVRIAEAALPY